MKVIRIKKENASVLRPVVAELKKGAIVVYPTDTAYAIGCDATNAAAVRKIFVIKGRPKTKAMPIICADLKMVEKYFLNTKRYSLYAKKYWPAPLSVVVEAKKGIAKAALASGTAAVRVPDSLIAQTISKFLGRPLVATSANFSGAPTCYSAKAFLRQFEKQPAPRLRGEQAALSGTLSRPRAREIMNLVVLDAGALRHRKPSTIIKINKDGLINVIRKGSIGLDIRH